MNEKETKVEPVSAEDPIDTPIMAKLQQFIDDHIDHGVSLQKTDREKGIVTIKHARYGSISIDINTGEIDTKIKADTPVMKMLNEALNGPVPAQVPATVPPGDITRTVSSLTITDVKTYFCPPAPDTDAYIFLEVCKSKNLNPFLKEAYLVAYEDKKNGGYKTSIIVGKDAFVRKAEEHPEFEGFRAGLIIQNANGEIQFDREGEFLAPGETLLGGWAEVKRKEIEEPFKATVSLVEYKKDNPFWRSMPATLIRKVALVHALREAFADTLGGIYDESEMGGGIP